MVALGISYVGLLVALLEITSFVSAGPKKDPSKLPPNTAQGLSMAEAKKHPKRRVPKGTHRSAFNPPPAFDARIQWPKCKSISTIRDQGACGDCWAVAGAAVLSDRLCIASGKQDQISAMQAAGCSYPDKSAMENCNIGGHISQAFRTAVLYGLATGGELGSKAGCVPYEITGAGPAPISCATTCTNKAWKKKLAADTLENTVDSYWVEYNPVLSDQAKIDEVVKHMKEELFTHGPIAATIKIWSGFNQWTKDKGAYSPNLQTEFTEPSPKGMHAIRIIGWNQTADGTPYWMISNSWGDIWGEKGIFWVEMGKNTILIESNVAAPIVKLETKCATASFCTSTIDQAVRMDYKDPSSPIFLFQGECALQVEIKEGRLKKVGEAEPIAKKVVNAPKGPIITHRLNTDTGALGLINAAGDSGSMCVLAANSKKYVCESVPWKLNAEAFTVTQTGKYYKYDDNGATLWGGAATKTSEGSTDAKLNGVFTKGNMTSVQAFLDIDGTKMFVFGKDTNGKPLRGILSYPTDSAPVKWLTKPGTPNAAQAC